MHGRRHRRPVAVLVVAAVLGAGTACTSAHGSRHSPSGTAATPGPGALSTAVPALPAAIPSTPKALAALMTGGLARTGYAHVDFDTSLSGTSLRGTGRATLAAGRVTALDIQDVLSGLGPVRFILAGSVGYAALPRPTRPGKPYAVVGGSVDSDQLNRAAIGLQATKLLAAPETYRVLAAAVSRLTLVGKETLGATPVLHYRGPVQVERIPQDDPVRLAFAALNVPGLSLDLWVDGAGRPVKAAAPSSDGRTSNVTFTAINVPFRIAAPPAAQVDGAR